jgi:hypothetical protein
LIHSVIQQSPPASRLPSGPSRRVNLLLREHAAFDRQFGETILSELKQIPVKTTVYRAEGRAKPPSGGALFDFSTSG